MDKNTMIQNCIIGGIAAGLIYLKLFPLKYEKRKEVDVLIVGYGLAGATAAIDAASNGDKNCEILIIERFDGGGSTYRSAGIIYAGGGTASQKKFAVDDTPENMYNYLKLEVGSAVSDKILKKFAYDSAPNMKFLRDVIGVPIDKDGETAFLYPYKSTSPPDKYTLMYSGSETAAPFRHHANPCPRGHRPESNGNGNLAGSGNILFNSIHQYIISKLKDNISIWTQCQGSELIVENNNKVIGCKVKSISHIPFFLRWIHQGLYTLASLMNPAFRIVNPPIESLIHFIEYIFAREYEIYTKRGVVLATGGFQRNNELVQKYIPAYYGGSVFPIGGIGENGSGLQMAMNGVDAKTSHMNIGTSWRFIQPPDAFASGIMVDANGERHCTEDCYGARLSNSVLIKGNDVGWLVIDQSLFNKVYDALLTSDQLRMFHYMWIICNLYWNRKKANTIEELEKKCGIKPGGLKNTLSIYNQGIKEQAKDIQFDKLSKFLFPIENGPFYAIDFSKNGSYFYAGPIVSLGGVVVDDDTGMVLNNQNQLVNGLYACGRAACGIPSTSYVTGLSLADCIFSGRRVGHALASMKSSS